MATHQLLTFVTLSQCRIKGWIRLGCPLAFGYLVAIPLIFLLAVRTCTNRDG